jgi:hypothetical protein
MGIHIEHIEARSMLVLDGHEDRVKFFNIRHCWVRLERYPSHTLCKTFLLFRSFGLVHFFISWSVT